MVDFQVGSYVKARINAFSETIKDAANMASTETPVGDLVQILTSGFGLLPVNEFGARAQKRREEARKTITGGIGRRI